MERTCFPSPHLSQRGYSNTYVLHMDQIAMVCHLSPVEISQNVTIPFTTTYDL